MGVGTIVWLAVIGGIIAGACAVACALAVAWLARSARDDARSHGPSISVLAPHQAPHASAPRYVAVAPAPMHPSFVQQQQPETSQLHHAPVVHASTPRGAIVLEGSYPQLGNALGAWLQAETDDIERIRIARDLGTVGDARSARALLDGVRTGVLSPTVAADNLQRGGFEAGIAVAAALRDPEPRVRALATSLVGRTTPLEPANVLTAVLRPMPEPPSRPHA